VNLAVSEIPGFRERLSAHDAERVSVLESPPLDSWPRLAEAALHGLAGDYVRRLTPHTEADPVAILVTFLVAFGNVSGRSSFVRVENDRHYPNLFAVAVGETSNGRKGTSAGQALRLFEKVDHDWRTERVVSGLSTGEGLIHYLQGKAAQDTAADRRVFVLESEFASVLRVAEREGNTLFAILRAAWDGGSLRVMTRKDPLRVDEAHTSIVGHITKEELRRYLKRTEVANGFANRFLWIAVRRSQSLPEGGAAHLIDWEPLADRLRHAVTFARSAGEIRKSPAAVEDWASVYPEISEGRPGLLGAITGRAAAQTLRLSLVYALLDGSREILPEHLAAALALEEFARASARWVFGDATGDREADRILEAVGDASPKGLSLTEVSNLFGRNQSSERISEAVRLLENAGLVTVDRMAGAGRSTTRIRALRGTNQRTRRNKPPGALA
jgi:hypothetical protein